MRLIDADLFIKRMRDYCYVNDVTKKIIDTLSYITNVEAEFHSVDAAPVRHGHYVGEGDGYANGELVYDVWKCSELTFLSEESANKYIAKRKADGSDMQYDVFEEDIDDLMYFLEEGGTLSE